MESRGASSATTLAGSAALGRAIRRLRLERRFTIEMLALGAGLHSSYLSGIERGLRNPTWGKVAGLARALDVPLSRIAQEAEQEGEIAQIATDPMA
jgi:transcriptional regulator with XRE-family HTH domain